MSSPTFFVAGATGYTGREVVRLALEQGCRVVAHIRPESQSRARWEKRFTELGAAIDLSPWEPEAMAGAAPIATSFVPASASAPPSPTAPSRSSGLWVAAASGIATSR